VGLMNFWLGLIKIVSYKDLYSIEKKDGILLHRFKLSWL